MVYIPMVYILSYITLNRVYQLCRVYQCCSAVVMFCVAVGLCLDPVERAPSWRLCRQISYEEEEMLQIVAFGDWEG